MELANYWKSRAEKAEKEGDKLESECCYRYYKYYKKIADSRAY